MTRVASTRSYDVIVVGAGHAGCEAALAAARMGCRTAVFTANLDSIALMPCNPAIGGIAKGHLVREIDALGGEMARCIDKTGIQFRVLNRSKGPAVRGGEFPANGLSEDYARLGFPLGRLKTGTCPRLDARTIDFDILEEQPGDEPPPPFSFDTEVITQSQLPCYLTYTNAQTHAVIARSLDRSPLYSGVIKGIGPRYCPSIEDKIKRFPDKERHQIFLEPEGRDTVEIYPNGNSTSLPEDVQVALVRSIRGLE